MLEEVQQRLVGPTGRTFKPPPGRYWRISEAKFREFDADGRIWWGPNQDARPSIKRFLSEVEGATPRTLWRHVDVGSNRTSKNEMRALFPGVESFATPKPERLIARIIRIATDPGDVVLDCYAGSGTTAAVAHKLERRWITSEWSASTIENYTLPRLTKVVNGDDPGGITSETVPVLDELPKGFRPGAATAAARTLTILNNSEMLSGIDQQAVRALIRELRAVDRSETKLLWSGGGGFRVLDVGRSMFEEVGGRVYLAEWAADAALGEAVAAQFAYAYEPDGPFSGRKGKTRLAVIDGLVNGAVLRLLVDQLGEGEKLTVAGTAVDPECRAILRELRPGSTIKRVPASILDEYRVRRRDRIATASVLDWAAVAEVAESAETHA